MATPTPVELLAQAQQLQTAHLQTLNRITRADVKQMDLQQVEALSQ